MVNSTQKVIFVIFVLMAAGVFFAPIIPVTYMNMPCVIDSCKNGNITFYEWYVNAEEAPKFHK